MEIIAVSSVGQGYNNPKNPALLPSHFFHPIMKRIEKKMNYWKQALFRIRHFHGRWLLN